MFLRDVVIDAEQLWNAARGAKKEQVALFQRNTYFITDLFVERIRKNIRSENVAKIILKLRNDLKSADASGIKLLIDILRVDWPFEIESYFQESMDYGKKKLILGLLRKALTWICHEKEWDTSAIEDAYNGILDQGIYHNGFWRNGKAWPSPNKQTKMRLFFDFDLERFRFFCIFFDNKNAEIGRKCIVDELSYDAPFLYYWKEVKWVSNKSLRLRTKDGRLFRCDTRGLDSDNR